MSTEVITALISGAVTLLVSIGTWHVSMKQHRIKTQAAMTEAIDDMKDTMTANNAEIQQHLAVIDLKIETLSDRVEKHNQVIDRTRVLEKDVAVHEEQIKVANHRIEDLEKTS
jgi:Zn-dependent metalloprotease